MRYLILPVIALILTGLNSLSAQVTLFADDFNTCSLSPGWQVTSTGNPNSTWYVGLVQNNDIPGQSIDSSCFLFIDDYATGKGTPGYILSFITPAFDVTPYTTVECTMDIYFRFGETDFLEIVASDGTTETILSRFDNFRTNGPNITEHFTFRQDLALVSQSPNTKIIIRYTSPAGSFGHYAGIDNIRITGSGKGTNVIREAFNYCTKPAGWTAQVLSGLENWKFNRVPLGSSAFYSGNSMDGSCFVFFDDNAAGENAPASSMRLISPWFPGTEYFKYELNYDAIMRYSGKESFSVFLENGLGEKTTLFQSTGQVNGPFFPNYGHYTFDLSPYRSQQLRLIFEYSDGNSWGYWAGLDNIKVTGMGPAIDFCANSQTLTTGAPCTAANNATALFDGPPATCTDRTSGTLWFRWQADFTGIARFSAQSDFNDVVSVYSGSCAAPKPELCDNRDEHGFSGENTYFPVTAGTTYFMRVSGQEQGFGIPRGNVCVKIDQVGGYPNRPANDDCDNAVALTVNAACVAGDNTNALTSGAVPSLNVLARADIWYKFTAGALGANEQYRVSSQANFSDIITVYRGSCAALEEVAGNHNGGGLDLPALIPGQTYYVQIAGNFATVEGSLCAQVAVQNNAPPANNNCINATPAPLGNFCTPGNNLNASFSGYKPSCALTLDRDIWFKFTAPLSGIVNFNTGATFEHTLAVWGGDCDSLYEVFCVPNPLRCNGFINAADLVPGQTYYVQIASYDGGSGIGTGSVCINILDGQATINFTPLDIDVKLPCVGKDSAKVVIIAHGGVPPLSYPANTNGQIIRSGDMYLVVVSDSTGCQAHRTGIVAPCASNECTMNATLTSTPPTCFGDSNGKIVAGAEGGTGPFLFNWSNGIPTATNSGLSAGTYTLTIIDANGCDLVVSATIDDPDPIVVTADSIRRPATGQSNGAIHTGITGGSGQFIFVWTKDGQPVGASSPNLDDIPAGEYALLVTDTSGCTGTFSYTLTETVSAGAPQDAFYATVIPNPAHDKAVLAVAFPHPRDLVLGLMDSNGRMLRSWSVAQAGTKRMDLDLKGLPDGVYHLRIQAGKEVVSKRVVVGH